jgi:hypothetical protein
MEYNEVALADRLVPKTAKLVPRIVHQYFCTRVVAFIFVVS